MPSTLRNVLAGLLAAPLLAAAGQDECPSALLERFISADCEACWRSGTAPDTRTLVLDWIVPSALGDDAPLSAAAIAEAKARATSLASDATLERRHALPPRGPPVEVEDGPAWNGYIGLRLRVQRAAEPLPPGAAGYLALVETVPAGDEGTPIARRVVRVLAGPLALDPARPGIEHLLAMRIPQGARSDRLGAVGWVETGSGELLALAQAGGEGCAAAR